MDTSARLSALLGPHRQMVVFGGGSRSRPWVAAKAAVAGLPVLRSTAPEATARGAALVALERLGWLEPSPPEAEDGELVEPDPARAQAFARLRKDRPQPAFLTAAIPR